ncbi:hypothetical protein KJ781_01405 [Patescibacteria group bacterium]|nr:hypothetical protein [Patescibacteria group bacterium]MBU1448819.1 hypothetical protein [Patescibacteria group bacterium]MBU2613079.1 hypothetical protein [Patescibacteria group bacterium]
MDDKLKKLLRIVVEDVIKTGEAVGSQRLVETYGLDMSPATIRNWFGVLEEEGYLLQLHTSAGRLPTEQGYRFYLEELMSAYDLQRKDVLEMQRAAAELERKADALRRMARAMSEMTRDAVLYADRDMHAYAAGIANLLSQPEFMDRDRLMHLGETLDRMDETLDRLASMRFDEPTPLIGSDCPFGEGCGSVFLTMHDGSLFGILGPMRMDYQRGIALLRAAKHLAEDDETTNDDV